jgi:hypothetical protein
MPSRRAVALILAFWLATTGYVAYRDLWPLYFASGPPSVGIDLADEAAQNVPVRWAVKWNGKEAGRLKTQMSYVPADDTFWFTTQYRGERGKDLRMELPGVTVSVPEFKAAVRVTRGGNLREQTFEGKLSVEAADLTATLGAKLAGQVVDGKLVAKFEGGYDVGGRTQKSIAREFDPVPVPAGQPLNPLQPVNRLVGVRPGREWVVHESNPLNDAILALARELGLPPQKPQEPLVGRVQSETSDLDWNGERVACWVIDYRREGELQVRTWVRESDGKVLKQEAYSKGETLSIERDE